MTLSRFEINRLLEQRHVYFALNSINPQMRLLAWSKMIPLLDPVFLSDTSWFVKKKKQDKDDEHSKHPFTNKTDKTVVKMKTFLDSGHRMMFNWLIKYFNLLKINAHWIITDNLVIRKVSKNFDKRSNDKLRYYLLKPFRLCVW